MQLGRRPRELDAKLFQTLYEANKSCLEISKTCKCSRYAVYGYRLRYHYPERSPQHSKGKHIKRPPGMFARTTYHANVSKLRGKPKLCDGCLLNDPAATYHWANRFGNYADPWDYDRLCASCHRYLDEARRRDIDGATTQGVFYRREKVTV